MKKIISVIAVAIIIVSLFSSALLVKAQTYNEETIIMKYYSGGSWTSFSPSCEKTSISGLRLTTNHSFYLKYRTLNSGKTGFYSAVNSTSTADSAYAGTGHLESTQRNIQCLGIDVYNAATDSKISSGIVVMYRVKISSGWLSWVSNAPSEEMQIVKNTYSLDGNLDAASSYAGKQGEDICGIEIRVFVLSDTQELPIELSGTEQTPVLKYAEDTSELIGFNKKLENKDIISAIQIETDKSKNYYLSYSVSAEGNSGYYSAVKSIDNDYAGIFGRAIEAIRINVFDLNGRAIDEGVVVLYRVYTDKWLPWVSNATSEYMNSVKLRYNIAGQLDFSSSYAGVKGKRIKGIEIRVFEEKELLYDCGSLNLTSLSVPYISQVNSYPTGCESVSTVMALNFMGNSITVDDFIDKYLDKSPYIHNFDPNECFGGDPRSSSGMGCWSPAIMKALNKFLPETSLYALNVSATSLEELCQTYIDDGIPVILWATQDMKNAYKVNYEEGLEWIAPEHCLVMTGYDERCYIFNDPLKNQNVHYLKADVNESYKALGMQSIVILSKNKPEKPNAPKVISNIGTSVVLNEGYEYSKDSVSWQRENAFENIELDKVYTFYQRIPETETSIASEISEPLYFVKASGVKHGLSGATKIVLDFEEGYEYSIDTLNWQESNVFEGLIPMTEYKVYRRLKGEDIYSAFDENAKTFITDGADFIADPTSLDLVALRKLLLKNNRTNLANDFTGDNIIDVRDLIRLKKIMAGI